MRIGILANRESWYLAQLLRAADDRGDEAIPLEFPRMIGRIGSAGEKIFSAGQGGVRSTGVDLAGLDLLLVRTMPHGSLEQVVFRMDVLARLEARGTVVVNPPRGIECAVDKFLATSRIAAGGLETPETVVCETSASALEAFEALGGDVVVKPQFGAEGRGMMHINDPDLALRAFHTLEKIGAVLYVQRYIPHDGSDIRVLVLDGEVLGAIRRRGEAGEFRTNVARNGKAEPHEPNDCEASAALRAAEATGVRFAGVDLLYDREGRLYVLEVNGVPGWRAFQQVTGLDVPRILLDHLADRL